MVAKRPVVLYNGQPQELSNGDGLTVNGPLGQVDYVDFDVEAVVSGQVGRLRWNSVDGTLEFTMAGGNITQQIGQELPISVKHADANGLTNGSVVYQAGSNGDNILVRYAQANAELTSSKVFGLMTESSSGGAPAFCTTFGIVRDLDTSTLTEGAAVWLSPSVAGGMTSTKPVAPNHLVFVGLCIRSHAVQGKIFVNPQNGYELDELHDVLISSKADADSLYYDATVGVWKNKTPTQAKVLLLLNNVENKSSATIRSEITSTNVTTALGFTPENAANKGIANGYASLNSSGQIPSTQLPSYVDDVIEVADEPSLPTIGEAGKIYVVIDTVPNKIFRWSGSAYISIGGSGFAGTTDNIAEGSVNLWFTNARARAAISVTQNLSYSSTTGLITGPDLSGYLTSSTAATTYQALDADLTAIAALTGTSGFLKKTAANTWSLDTSTYLTGNQSISFTGDATGSGTTSVALTLAASGVTTGTYKSVTVDAKGRVTAGSNPTTLSGYGITDAQPLDADLTAIAALLPTADNFIVGTGTTWALETPAQARTSLGATTLGGNLFTLTNVAAISFPRINADNTISALDAATFRTAIGAGTSSTTGTVTSVGGTGTVSGLILSGTVTSSGNLTLGGTLAVTAANFASQTANTVLAAPNGVAGVPTFRALVAADIPTLNQNTTGTAATITGTYSGTLTSSQITTGLGFTPYNSTNPSGFITGTGSTTGSSGSVTGLTLTSSANGINPDNVTQNQLGYNNSVSLFGQTDGGLYSSVYSSAWVHQIYGDFRTGQIAIRGKNSGVWQGWRTVLDSSNYNSYSPTLTGGGASGTWGISITGSAGSVAWTNVSGRPTAVSSFTNDSGYITSSGSISGNAATATTAVNVSGGYAQGSYLGVQQTAGSGAGISLYNGYTTSQPTYGLMFATTANFGTHGGVTADWATYFTMDATANRGWIFRDTTNGNKASISNNGTAVFNGNVTAYSDESLKTNWRKLPDNYVQLLSEVKYGIYDRIDDTTLPPQVGVSAQSLLKLLPYAIIKSGGLLAVAYGNAAMVSTIEVAKLVVEQDMRIKKLEELLSKLI